MSTSISHTTKTYPKHPYSKIKEDVLGNKYELSLVFIGEKRARELNKKYRKKSYVPNVLSFPIEKNIGEIYICPTAARAQAKKFDMTQNGYICFLFIHGLYHLKGYDHSDEMEKLEQKAFRKYNLH